MQNFIDNKMLKLHKLHYMEDFMLEKLYIANFDQ